MADKADFPALVSCEWLKEKLTSTDHPDLVLLDVSWSSKKNCNEDYTKSHIPGAVYFNVMSDHNSDLFPRDLPDIEAFQAAARRAGINPNSHVIVCSSSDVSGYFLSGRAWWTLTYFGVERVSILDGGLPRWLKLGYPMTSEATAVKPGQFQAKKVPEFRRTYEDVKDNLESRKFLVCDTRAPPAYKGEESKGHIPGAENLQMATLVNSESGTLKTVDELRTAFSAAGVDLRRPLVTHCNSGMSSCTVAFAARLCGSKDASVYHGGFTEWSTLSPELIEKSQKS